MHELHRLRPETGTHFSSSAFLNRQRSCLRLGLVRRAASARHAIVTESDSEHVCYYGGQPVLCTSLHTRATQTMANAARQHDGGATSPDALHAQAPAAADSKFVRQVQMLSANRTCSHGRDDGRFSVYRQ